VNKRNDNSKLISYTQNAEQSLLLTVTFKLTYMEHIQTIQVHMCSICKSSDTSKYFKSSYSSQC